MNRFTRWLFATLLFCVALAPMTAVAQRSGLAKLETDAVIHKYRKARNAIYVDVGKDLLSQFNADYCRTLTLKPTNKEQQYIDIENALSADRLKAVVIQELVRSGRLVSAYYQFASADPFRKRYILYNSDANGNIYLISIGSPMGSEELVERLLTYISSPKQ